jgi:alanine dehydrogenase
VATSTNVPHFGRDEILALDPEALVEAMASALAMVSRGSAIAPIRSHIDLGNDAGTYTIPGVLPEADIITVKVISIRPENPGRGLRRLQGFVSAFEASTGRLVATLDSAAATEARTSACTALSIRLMARPDADVLTVFGTGPQALAHLRTLRRVRSYREVRVVGRMLDSAKAVAREDRDLIPSTPAEGLRGAGVVVTATNSVQPLFGAEQLEGGAHLALVGSGNAHASEVPPELLGRAESIRVDHLPTCLAESGEIVDAVRQGVIDPEAVRELGEVVLGRLPGRYTPDGITIYKSVGNGTQDAALAAILLGKSLPAAH